MKIIQVSHWDEKQIQHFLHLKKMTQGHLSTYFPEKIEDYKRILHQDSPFAQDYEWRGVIVLKDESPVATGILAWRKNSEIGNLGFIDWVNDLEAAQTLIEQIELLAKQSGLQEIKTPVDMNFFVKYRIKLPHGGHPLFGEPVYPDYYHDLFKQTGFGIVGIWDTYEVDKSHIIRSFIKKRKQLKKRNHRYEGEIVVRSIKLSQWDSELKIVYELFVKSFSEMPEFEPISFDQFKLVYDDFKYIIHPWYSYIMELDGQPVGFSINYPDPLPVLLKIKGKTLSVLEKVWLLIRLRTNFQTMMLAYVGKIPAPNGDEVKGILIKSSKKLTMRGFFFKKGLVCYQSSDSPSRRPIDPESLKPFSQYVLYGKKLK